jgi:hypothetical protein
MNLDDIKTGLSNKFGMTGLYLQKHSPEILLGAGLVGMVATVVMASKATLKAETIIIDHNQKKADIDLAGSLPGDYSEQDALKDKATLYIQTSLKFAKLYGPAISVGALSIAAILSSHGVMAKRQASLVAAYGLMAKAYEAYRERVREELGEEKDMAFHLGLKEETYSVKETDEDGKTVKVKKTRTVATGLMPSMYARCFDNSNRVYKSDRMMNITFITAQERLCNDMLILRGYLFLNEVYDRLGFDPTPEGQLVGWVLKSAKEMKQEHRDGYVSFGLNKNPVSREFMRGENDAIWLDFNVDGIVYEELRR